MIKSIQWILKKPLYTAFFWIFANSVAHAEVGISPVGVDMGGKRSAVVRVQNMTDETVLFEAHIKARRSHFDGEKNFKSRDIFVSPRVFKLAPKGVQTVRLNLRRSPNVDKELTYFLHVGQLSRGTAAMRTSKWLVGTGVKMKFAASIPVLLRPKPVDQVVRLEATRQPNGVTLRNTGNVSMVVQRLDLFDLTNNNIGLVGVTKRILVGQSVDVPIDGGLLRSTRAIYVESANLSKEDRLLTLP